MTISHQHTITRPTPASSRDDIIFFCLENLIADIERRTLRMGPIRSFPFTAEDSELWHAVDQLEPHFTRNDLYQLQCDHIPLIKRTTLLFIQKINELRDHRIYIQNQFHTACETTTREDFFNTLEIASLLRASLQEARFIGLATAINTAIRSSLDLYKSLC